MSDTTDAAVAVATAIAKDAYADGGTPIVKPTGQLIGLLPRAIKAAFLPVEKWVLGKEYALQETEKLLAQKLANVSPELIVPLEAHIAVPALQYISYCMDNEQLREMYANLLANSMNKVVKNGVHPSFVEIIKQLSPDEAKILKYLMEHSSVPTLHVRYNIGENSGIYKLRDFTTLGIDCGCEAPYEMRKNFDNLERLGLLNRANGRHLTAPNIYEPLENHPKILSIMQIPSAEAATYTNSELNKSYVEITAFGQSFCNICMGLVVVKTNIQ